MTTDRKFLGAECANCPLKKFASVPSRPVAGPAFAIVGEGPGFEEILVKEPFVGTAGKLLNQMLKAVGLDRSKASVYNATSCFPNIEDKRQKDKAVAEAVRLCSGRLMRELADLPKDVPILVLGTPARDALGMKSRDRWEITNTGHRALATYHPAAALYMPGMAVHTYAALYKFATPWPDYPGIPDFDIWRGGPWPRWLFDISPDDFITLDVEADGPEWYGRNRLLYLGIAAPKVPGRDPREVGSNVLLMPEKFIYSTVGRDLVHYLFERYPGQVGGHNFKFDMNFLASQMHLGDDYEWWDTILMSRDLNEHWIKGLKPLSVYFFDVEDWKERIVEPLLKKEESDKEFDDEINYALVPVEELTEYLAHDVHYNLLLAYQMREELQATKCYDVPYKSYEVPHARELHLVEQRGVAVDIDGAVEAEKFFEAESARLTELLAEQSNGVIKNPRSWMQVGRFWYDVLHFPPPNIVGKPARTTCDAAIDKFLKYHPSVETLSGFRKVDKMLTSYVRPIIRFAVLIDGVWRVFPSYKQAHVTTGRLSAKNPAIQTTPRDDDEYGLLIKNLFIAPPGFKLVAVDGSQWELRVIAAWSLDPKMLEIYRRGGSIHKETADLFFPVGWDHHLYVRVKNFVFAWAYGGKAESAVYVFELPTSKRVELVGLFNEMFAGAVVFRERLYKMASTTGEIKTPLGHIIHYPVVTQYNQRDVEKTAINYPIQGTASQLISVAGFRSGDALRRLGAYPIIYKHDEIVAEVPEDKINEVARLLSDAIVGTAQEVFPVIPWVAEAEVGQRWGSMEGYSIV